VRGTRGLGREEDEHNAPSIDDVLRGYNISPDEFCGLGAVVYLKSLVSDTEVLLHGRLREVKARSYLAVAQPLGGQFDDLPLAGGQVRQVRDLFRSGFSSITMRLVNYIEYQEFSSPRPRYLNGNLLVKFPFLISHSFKPTVTQAATQYLLVIF
jgi:hypothetical protein